MIWLYILIGWLYFTGMFISAVLIDEIGMNEKKKKKKKNMIFIIVWPLAIIWIAMSFILVLIDYTKTKGKS